MKPLLLTILICFILLTAFAQEEQTKLVTIEGLVSIDNAPKKELCIITNWAWKKSSYYFVVGDYKDEVKKYLGKVIRVSGQATLIRRFGWGGGEYELEVKEILEQTKQDILQTYGEPYWKSGYKDIEVWYYRMQRMNIFFDKGKAVKIDVVTEE